MSVQFRQRTLGEYARIIWKRKWLIILPMIAVASAVTWVVLRLPDIYESTTLIVVKPSTIPTTIVPTLSEETLTRQLSTISQNVTSRSSLQPLIEKYHLYERERSRDEPMESIVDRMRKDIKVEVNTSRNDITNGFNITYRGSDPQTTQRVTAELASKYIDAQADNSTRSAKQNKEFFDRRIEEVKAELDEIARKRLDFMKENLGHLPGDQLLGVQLTGLFEQQKGLIADIGRMRDQQNQLNQQLGDLNKQRQQEIDNAIVESNDPKKAPEYLTLAQRESDIEAEIRNMKQTLKEKNPDLIKKREELADVQAKMERVVAEEKAKAEEKKKRLEAYVDPRINQVKYSLEAVKGELARQQQLLAETNTQIASIQQRINEVPGAQVGLEELEREYQTKKASYDALQAQQQKVDLIAGMQTNMQGDTITVVDVANLPERPVAPKRPMLIIMGVMFGLMLGLALAGAFEVPRLLTIQTTNDAEHYTGLPVLVSVPELLTPQEARRIPRRRLLLITAGIVATIISIPALAYALKLTHIFDKLAS